VNSTAESEEIAGVISTAESEEIAGVISTAESEEIAGVISTAESEEPVISTANSGSNLDRIVNWAAET
jgi:hypothetical protein